MQKTVIKYQNVEVKFGNQEIIKDISFNIYENDFVNIVGPNGAGKTTLIRTLINDIKVNKGNIFIEDVSLGYVPQKQLVKQNFPITVLEFIYMGFNNQKLIIPKEDITKIKEALNDMDLSADILNEKISYLSGGELQRIYLARSLVANPKILILDEPASALDPLFREHFYIFLNKLWKNGTTIINITHDLTDIELHGTKVMYLDRIIKFFGDSKNFKEFEHEGHSHE